MKKECDRYPEYDHKDCELDRYEKIVAEYLESQGLNVERLCKERLPNNEGAPDFRITRGKNLCCLCEVKALKSSPTGALTESDWKYANRMGFKHLKELAESQNVPLIVDRDQMRLWKGEIAYPTEGRDTAEKENEYEKKLKDYLGASSVADRGLNVEIHRSDWLVWTEEELRDFADYLIEKLKLIDGRQIPKGWHEDFGIIGGTYTKKREDVWHIKNEIVVTRMDSPVSVKVYHYLGPNWMAIEERCKKAQKQIRDRLKREATPDEIARFVIVFLEKKSFLSLSPNETEKLLAEISKRIVHKFQNLSAIAFSDISVDSEAQANYSDMSSHYFPHSPDGNRRFLVFHISNQAIPRLSDEVFDDGYSGQIRFPV